MSHPQTVIFIISILIVAVIAWKWGKDRGAEPPSPKDR